MGQTFFALNKSRTWQNFKLCPTTFKVTEQGLERIASDSSRRTGGWARTVMEVVALSCLADQNLPYFLNGPHMFYIFVAALKLVSECTTSNGVRLDNNSSTTMYILHFFQLFILIELLLESWLYTLVNSCDLVLQNYTLAGKVNTNSRFLAHIFLPIKNVV